MTWCLARACGQRCVVGGMGWKSQESCTGRVLLGGVRIVLLILIVLYEAWRARV